MATVTATLQAPLTPALFPDASEWKTSGPPLSAEQLKGLCLRKDVPSLVLYEPRSGSPVQGILTPTPLPLPGVGGRPRYPPSRFSTNPDSSVRVFSPGRSQNNSKHSGYLSSNLTVSNCRER